MRKIEAFKQRKELNVAEVFPFIASISTKISNDWGDLVNDKDFTVEMLNEIITNISMENNFVIIDENNKLKDCVYCEFQKSYCKDTDIEFGKRYFIYHRYHCVNIYLENLYYITDNIEYQKYLLQQSKEVEEEHLRTQKKINEEQQKSFKDMQSYIDDAVKYKLDTVDMYKIGKYRKAEKLVQLLKSKEPNLKDIVELKIV